MLDSRQHTLDQALELENCTQGTKGNPSYQKLDTFLSGGIRALCDFAGVPNTVADNSRNKGRPLLIMYRFKIASIVPAIV
jgi:hypothetical protein